MKNKADPMDAGFKGGDVLVIGLGGHKCGSTWLYRYLRSHPECFAPLIKELAYFSDEGNYDWLWRAKGRMKMAFAELEKFENLYKAQENPDENADQYTEMRALVHDLNENVASLTRYAPYEMNFSRRKPAQSRLVDITPAYALLDDETYQEMVRAHDDVRFIFIMRDPAERLFSAFRYAFKRKSKGFAPRERVRLQQLQDWLSGREIADLQTDYPRILDKMERHIAPDKRLVLFYENLFNDGSIGKICAFLGIGFVPGKYDMRIHQTDSDETALKMSDIEREFLVDRYRYVYKEIKSRFGAEAPPEWNWPKGL